MILQSRRHSENTRRRNGQRNILRTTVGKKERSNMATIQVTPEEKKELESKGYLVRDVPGLFDHRRRLWDVKESQWTGLLPGDAARTLHYLKKVYRNEQGRAVGRCMLSAPDGLLPPEMGGKKLEIDKAKIAEAMNIPIAEIFPEIDESQ